MTELIIEFKNSISELICDDIIEKYIEQNKNMSIFEIPKNNIEWNKIELLMYKQLLISINKYKNNILYFNNYKSNNLIELLTKDLFTKSFIIHEIKPNKDCLYFNSYYRSNNRYNLLNYIFFLNNAEEGCEFEYYNYSVKSEKGKLILFPEDFVYKHKFRYPNQYNNYVIYGQICYENII